MTGHLAFAVVLWWLCLSPVVALGICEALQHPGPGGWVAALFGMDYERNDRE